MINRRRRILFLTQPNRGSGSVVYTCRCVYDVYYAARHSTRNVQLTRPMTHFQFIELMQLRVFVI